MPHWTTVKIENDIMDYGGIFELVYNILPEGWLSIEEARLLWRYQFVTEGNTLEVGCFKGRSAVLLAKCMEARFHAYREATGTATVGRHKNNSVPTLFCVDPFKGFMKIEDPSGMLTLNAFQENMKARDIYNVQLYQQKIEEWIPRRVGLAYLDGEHTFAGTVAQINKALTCCPSIIAIHDVNDTGDGVKVKDAAIQLLGTWDKRVERLAIWDRTKSKVNLSAKKMSAGREEMQL